MPSLVLGVISRMVSYPCTGAAWNLHLVLPSRGGPYMLCLSW
ncbi:MAG: hypothetical protein JWM18_4616 [Chloroflexi bacterium]|nr:hypothetical protein [Chloroflexota bacterium]